LQHECNIKNFENMRIESEIT